MDSRREPCKGAHGVYICLPIGIRLCMPCAKHEDCCLGTGNP